MNSAQNSTIRQPFIQHIHELRGRLVWCCLVFFIGAAVGYALYDPLLELVQRPIGQTLYYTSPTGGFNFVFKISATFGLILALPVLMYHLIKFLEPVTRKETRSTVLTYIIWSVNLAWAGILFGYSVSLPAALHFLTKFGGESIQSLITADEYFSFALAYIAGFALLFQLPLLIIFINRITPLKPSGMMGAQKWVILTSFVVAAILTPTPDPMNQIIMALPVILLYQVSIIIVWLLNRKPKTQRVQEAASREWHEKLQQDSASSHERKMVARPQPQPPVQKPQAAVSAAKTTESPAQRKVLTQKPHNPFLDLRNSQARPVHRTSVQASKPSKGAPAVTNQSSHLKTKTPHNSGQRGNSPTRRHNSKPNQSVLPRGSRPQLIDIMA